MKKFRFHWLSGKISEGEGVDVEDAFRRLGYGGGAIHAVDYYEEVKQTPPIEGDEQCSA